MANKLNTLIEKLLDQIQAENLLVVGNNGYYSVTGKNFRILAQPTVIAATHTDYELSVSAGAMSYVLNRYVSAADIARYVNRLIQIHRAQSGMVHPQQSRQTMEELCRELAKEQQRQIDIMRAQREAEK